jgi:hypothetical protein
MPRLRFPSTVLAALFAAALMAPAAAQARPAYGLLANGSVCAFDTAAASGPCAVRPVTGLGAGEKLVGIDMRPATETLYGVSFGGGKLRVYSLALSDASVAATPLGATSQSATGTSFGVDFNPAADRLRVVTDTDENYRFDPDTGNVSGVDTALNPGAHDVREIAYDTNVVAAASSTLYDVDDATDTLYRQGGPDGTPSPNFGTLTAIGPLDINPGPSAGFDIVDVGDAADVAFLLTSTGRWRTVDLETGSAGGSGIVQPPAGQTFTGLAVSLDQARVRFQSSAPSVGSGSEDDGVATVRFERLGDTARAATVNVGYSDSTAAAGADYNLGPTTVSFAGGETTAVALVPLLDDGDEAYRETFTVTLTPSGPGLFTGSNPATRAPISGSVEILDSDAPAAADVPAETAYALEAAGPNQAERLLPFSTQSPGILGAAVTVTGLVAGEDLLGIDIRPQTEELYGVTSFDRIVRIDPATGQVANVGSGPLNLGAGPGNAVGIDFEPTSDTLRLVTSTDQNARVSPTTGARTDAPADGALAFTAGDACGPSEAVEAVGAAYSNSFRRAELPGTASTLYDLSRGCGALVRQDPSSSGTLTSVGGAGSLGVAIGAEAGFDIATRSGVAFAAFSSRAAGGRARLYTVDLANGLARLVGPFPDTLDIIDMAIVPDQARVAFSSAAVSAPEGGGTTLTLTRTGDLSRATTVTVGTSNGTATAGADFTGFTSATLPFAAGQSTATIVLPIANDDVDENDETLAVSITSVGDATLTGTPASTTVMILDDDGAGSEPTLRFASTAVTVSEAAGRVRLVVARTGSTANAVTVRFGTQAGTARTRRDFIPTTGTVLIRAGEATGTAVVRLANDRVAERSESFRVLLSAPAGGTLVAPTAARVTILDDDAAARPGLTVRSSTRAAAARRSGRALAVVRCRTACVGVVAAIARQGGRRIRIGSAPFAILGRRGGTARVSVRFTRGGRALANRRPLRALQLTATAAGPNGRQTATRRLR